MLHNVQREAEASLAAVALSIDSERFQDAFDSGTANAEPRNADGDYKARK